MTIPKTSAAQRLSGAYSNQSDKEVSRRRLEATAATFRQSDEMDRALELRSKDPVRYGAAFNGVQRTAHAYYAAARAAAKQLERETE